jgi:hypothetical protein
MATSIFESKAKKVCEHFATLYHSETKCDPHHKLYNPDCHDTREDT